MHQLHVPCIGIWLLVLAMLRTILSRLRLGPLAWILYYHRGLVLHTIRVHSS